MGDQGIIYCPDCMECECCTDGWQEKHKDQDYECVLIDDECIYKDNPNFPNHKCEPFETSTA